MTRLPHPIGPWARWCLLCPALLALLFLGLASLFPLHLDQRNFQDQRRVTGFDLPRGVPYLFISRDGEGAAYRFAGYVLHNLGYPSQDRTWVVLAMSATRATWALSLGEAGQLVATNPLRSPTYSAEEHLRRYLDEGVVLFDSADVRTEAERRLPALRHARCAHVLPPFAAATFPWRSPASVLSLVRLLRLTALVGLVLTLYALIWQLLPKQTRSRGLAAALTLPAATGVVLWMCSWSQTVPLAAPGPWVGLAWAGAAAWLWRVWNDEQELAPRPKACLCAAAALLVASVFLAMFLLRFDFDEDTHAHWMLMARSYYALGYHDPQSLTSHIHAATYPYALATILSVCAWAADLPRSEFLALNEGSSLTLLVYRLGMAGLALSAIAVLAAFLRLVASGGRLWLGAAALFPAMFPIVTGQHVGGESLMLPLMATSMVVLLAGRRTGSDGLLAFGLWLGAVATLVKLEGGLLFASAVLPWAASPGPASRSLETRMRLVVLALVLGFLPSLIWRSTLTVENAVYRWPSLFALRAVADIAAPTYSRCLLVIVREGWALLLLGALPTAALMRLNAPRAPGRRRAWELAIPTSIALSCFGLASIYLFSTLPRAWQIDVSYGRLLLLPSWSALMYCFYSLIPDPPETA